MCTLLFVSCATVERIQPGKCRNPDEYFPIQRSHIAIALVTIKNMGIHIKGPTAAWSLICYLETTSEVIVNLIYKTGGKT
jgi:hypothetical protein